MIEQILGTIIEFLRLTFNFGIIFLPFAFIARYLKKKYIKKFVENEIIAFIVSAHIVCFLVLAGLFIWIQLTPGETLLPSAFEEYGLTIIDYIGAGIAKIVYWNITAFVWAILSSVFYLVYLFTAKYLDNKIESELIRDLLAFAVGVAGFIFIIILLPWIFIGIEGMLWTALS